jgi:hypothetical protein
LEEYVSNFREEVYNVCLAEILCERGIDALPESIIKFRKMPDVRIFVKGVRIILEGKFNNKQKLNKQIQERIEYGLCDICIGVLYNQELRNVNSIKELKEKILSGKFDTSLSYQNEEGIVHNDFTGIDLKTLIEIINSTITLIINNNILASMAKKVEEELNSLTDYASRNNIWFNDMSLIKGLSESIAITTSNYTTKTKKDILKMTFFVLLDAMIFQESIKSLYSTINSLDKAASPLKLYFRDQWEEILKIDYKSIFTVSKTIIDELPNISAETEKILNSIKVLALQVINSGLLTRHDFMGRIYHKLLLNTTGQYYATYYTAVPSAYLLSEILFNEKSFGWNFNDLKELKKFKIIDPACGSGTLLSSCYISLRDLITTIVPYKKIHDYHKIMLEEVLYGWDVLGYATHLTHTVLGLHNPNVIVNKSNIATIPNGMDDTGKIVLGSITIMNKQMQFISEGLIEPVKIQDSNEIIESFDPYINSLGKFDLVVMNPPFTRSSKTNVKFGYSESNTKTMMDIELRKILMDNKLNGIGQAGLGAVFLGLAPGLLNKTGVIAFIIPRAILSGVSWQKIRQLFYDEFEIKYIISNYDPGDKSINVDGWSWSENTDLGEVMIIAQRTDKPLNERETVYVNLINKPRSEVYSICYANSIDRDKLEQSLIEGHYQSIFIDNKLAGYYYKVNQKWLNENWLAPCLFSSPDINKLILRLKEELPLISLGSTLLKGGVDIKQVKESFDFVSYETSYPVILGQQSSMNTINMENKFVSYGIPKVKRADFIYSSNKSAILLSERPHLGNDCLIAYKVDREILATAFWELEFKDKGIEKLLLLWFNSTFGLLLYLSSSTNSMAGIFKTKKKQFSQLKVLDRNNLKESDILEANMLYDLLKNERFYNFEKEFRMATSSDGTRYKIDSFFMRILNIKVDMSLYYSLLSKEPSITGKRL